MIGGWVAGLCLVAGLVWLACLTAPAGLVLLALGAGWMLWRSWP